MTLASKFLLSGGDGDDTLRVNTGDGTSVAELQGGAGSDHFTVGTDTPNSFAGQIVINAGADLDTFADINLAAISSTGSISLSGGGDGEALTLNTGIPGTVSISSTQVQRLGNGPLTYSGLAALTVNDTSGAETFNVANTGMNTATTINAGGGTDFFGPIDLMSIGAAGLTIDAGGDGEALTLEHTSRRHGSHQWHAGPASPATVQLPTRAWRSSR